NQALALSKARPVSQILARAMDVAAAVILRSGRYPHRLLNRRYRRLEAQLPFSGGPPATLLAEFLRGNSVHDVVVEPLMDPILWGEPPRFPRFLATGTRSPAPRPGP